MRQILISLVAASVRRLMLFPERDAGVSSPRLLRLAVARRKSPEGIPSLVGACLVLIGLTGCAGYKLGPSNGLLAGEKSIQIVPFSNQTLEPRMGEALTAALRKEIQRDGTFHLNTSGDADIVVTGEVTRLVRHGLTYQSKDPATTSDYRLEITTKLVARNRITGKEILNREVTGQTSIHIGSDQSSAERQARPLLAEDTARNITALLVDGDW